MQFIPLQFASFTELPEFDIAGQVKGFVWSGPSTFFSHPELSSAVPQPLHTFLGLNM